MDIITALLKPHRPHSGDKIMILVTGGAGFIGANFVLDWLAQTRRAGRQPRQAHLRRQPGEPGHLCKGDPRHVFVQGDIGDRALVERLLAEHRPRAVVNFAAESHVDRSIHGPGDFIQTNVVGTFRLLEAARAYWSALAGDAKGPASASSTSPPTRSTARSRQDEPAFTETHRYEPNSPYSASKAASDHLVRAYHHTYGLPVLTTNCSNNYGPYHFPEKLIPLMILNALAGKPLPVYGDGQQIRDWLYVEDHCSAIRRVLDGGRLGETYNIGGWNEKANLDLVQTICALLDELRPTRPADPTAQQITFVEGPPRPRPPLRHRRAQDRARTRLEAGGDLRDRHPQDRAVVSGQSGTGWRTCKSGAYRDSGWRTNYAKAGRRMKILLFGKNGQVGWELQRSLAPLGEVIALDATAGTCAATSPIRKSWRARCGPLRRM